MGQANITDLDQMSQNGESDHGLHCYITECYIKI